MRFGLMDTKVYAKEFTLKECAPGEMEICIENGSIDIDISHMVKDLRKSDREKVWEMARKVYGPVERGGLCGIELKECFGSIYPGCMFTMDVDEALEKYESWKKKHDVETVIKNLKPQDVVAVPSPVNNSVKNVMMITMLEHPSSLSYRMQGIDSDGCTVAITRRITDYKGLEKIGRVVETTDILGEIKKIEDEWRKNR